MAFVAFWIFLKLAALSRRYRRRPCSSCHSHCFGHQQVYPGHLSGCSASWMSSFAYSPRYRGRQTLIEYLGNCTSDFMRPLMLSGARAGSRTTTATTTRSLRPEQPRELRPTRDTTLLGWYFIEGWHWLDPKVIEILKSIYSPTGTATLGHLEKLSDIEVG